MSLDKFMYLLQHRRLFFTNAAGFSDKHEGKIPEMTLRYLEDHWDDYLENEIKPKLSLDEHVENLHYEVKKLSVNCWSMDRNESYALWKIYLGGAKAGVAIKSRMSLLRKAIESETQDDEPDIYFSEVKYVDYLKPEQLSPWRIISSKSPYYKYENEMRLLARPDANNPSHFHLHRLPSLSITVDLELLVEELYLSPFVGAWFKETFKEFVEKYNPALAQRLVHSRVVDV